MKVLLTVPARERGGGVSHAFEVLGKYLDADVEHFTVGARHARRNVSHDAARLTRDYARFASRVRSATHDIVHVNPSFDAKAFLRDAGLLLIAHLHRARTVTFVHGWDSSFEKWIGGALHPLLRATYFRSAAIIVLAEDFKRTLTRLGFTGRLYTLTTPVDDELLSGFDEDYIRRARPARERATVLFLARLDREKGIYTLLQAMRLVQQEFPQARLLVAGAGPDEAGARAEARRLGLAHCEFLGHVSGAAKADAFRQADLYVLPTTTAEGMPTSLLEAMAFGLPAVTRPVGGIRDFFQHGTMGFLTDRTDPEPFAAFIKTLLAEGARRRDMGVGNHRYAVPRFFASRQARALERIYQDVLDARGAGR